MGIIKVSDIEVILTEFEVRRPLEGFTRSTTHAFIWVFKNKPTSTELLEYKGYFNPNDLELIETIQNNRDETKPVAIVQLSDECIYNKVILPNDVRGKFALVKLCCDINILESNVDTEYIGLSVLWYFLNYCNN